ncbi:DUF226 domain-containing protein [Borrelia turicatae]|uniref:PF-50-type protein n=1 Tax=Borrelia turicatae (strain 91E135) TaxID=314724 RepID=A0ABF7R0A2_BORT9|nr:DUF226 domain-containing protein [Borrelia turicatae]ASJ27786.1 PF-50-type protein [Borrelia turicatae 91E135]UPA14254.1 DUF226 domain-containing protein [Borrelia turicatae 91E135]
MESILERLKKKKLEINDKGNESIFIKMEKSNNRTIYHTRIIMDFYTFGVNRNQKNKFFIAFRSLFNIQKIHEFNLFPLKGDDKFLGIFYGHKKPLQGIITEYEENGIMKASTLSKVYYIEFRFKKGSVFCYIKGIARLIKKEKSKTQYSQFLLELIINLEKQVYEFYGKNLPSGGIINKWIEKNLQ